MNTNIYTSRLMSFYQDRNIYKKSIVVMDGSLLESVLPTNNIFLSWWENNLKKGLAIPYDLWLRTKLDSYVLKKIIPIISYGERLTLNTINGIVSDFSKYYSLTLMDIELSDTEIDRYSDAVYIILKYIYNKFGMSIPLDLNKQIYDGADIAIEHSSSYLLYITVLGDKVSDG